MGLIYRGGQEKQSDGLPGESLCLASPLLAECPDVSSEVLVFWPHSQRCLCFPFSYFLNLNLRLSHTDGVYIDHTYPLPPLPASPRDPAPHVLFLEYAWM